MAQGTYLVVQWLRARLLMHKTQVQSLVRESTEPWRSRALTPQLEKTVSCKEEPEHHNERSCVPQLRLHAAKQINKFF